MTGPLAFLVAGVVDVLVFATASLWSRCEAARQPRPDLGGLTLVL